jgi:hypothetical protein
MHVRTSVRMEKRLLEFPKALPEFAQRHIVTRRIFVLPDHGK